MDGSLAHRGELIPTFVSRKARNGSDFPVGHLLLKVSLVIFYPADRVHQCLPTN